MRILTRRRLVFCLFAGSLITACTASVGPFAASLAGWKGGLRVCQRLESSRPRDPILVALQEHAIWERWTYEFSSGLSRRIDYDCDIELPEEPVWVAPNAASGTEGVHVLMVSSIASGWPFRAGVHVQWLGYDYPPGIVINRKGLERYIRRTEAGWPVWSVTSGNEQVSLVIPGRPIWGGLLASILFWSASVWLLVVACDQLRSSSRRRRRLCSRCGYPRPPDTPASAPCSECGQSESA